MSQSTERQTDTLRERRGHRGQWAEPRRQPQADTHADTRPTLSRCARDPHKSLRTQLEKTDTLASHPIDTQVHAHPRSLQASTHPGHVCIRTHTALGKQMPSLPITHSCEQKAHTARHTVLGAHTHRRPAHKSTHTYPDAPEPTGPRTYPRAHEGTHSQEQTEDTSHKHPCSYAPESCTHPWSLWVSILTRILGDLACENTTAERNVLILKFVSN